jgi:hypothetical protein
MPLLKMNSRMSICSATVCRLGLRPPASMLMDGPMGTEDDC